MIAARIKKAGRPYCMFNAELSGETTAVALRRIDWILRHPCDVIGGG